MFPFIFHNSYHKKSLKFPNWLSNGWKITMKSSLLKWLFLCTLATFPYNLWGLLMGAFQPSFQANGFLIGAFILFMGFATVFYWLDNWLILHQYTDFSKIFLQVVGIKFMLSVLGVFLMAIMETLVNLRYLFYAFFADVYLTYNFYEFLLRNARDTAQILIPNIEWYKLFEILVLVPIYLVIESIFLILGSLVLALVKQKFKKN